MMMMMIYVYLMFVALLQHKINVTHYKKPGKSRNFKFGAWPLKRSQLFLTRNFNNFKINFLGKNCDIFMLKIYLYEIR